MLINGISLSEGLGFGKIVFINNKINVKKKSISNVEGEIEYFMQTINDVCDILRARNKMFTENIDIVNVHIAMISDLEIIKETTEYIKENKCSADYAYFVITNKMIELFDSIEDKYFKERKLDINEYMISLDEPSIICGNNLLPSLLLSNNKQYIKGVITFEDCYTSHFSIIARELNIPIVYIKEEVKEGLIAIVDGVNSKVVIAPGVDDIKQYESDLVEFNKRDLEHKDINLFYKNRIIKVMANISSLNDINSKGIKFADGIGLVRTECLVNTMELINRQEMIYQNILFKFKDFPVVIRTFDFGFDKGTNFDMKVEERKSLFNEKYFKAQVRDILNANKYNNLYLMIPFIKTIDELENIKNMVKDVEKSISNKSRYKFGFTVETMDAYHDLDNMLDMVDFISIGTNDLLSDYLKQNRFSGDFNRSFDEKFIEIIKNIIDKANMKNKEVSVCGELANHNKGVDVLFNLGLRIFSVSPNSIYKVKNQISKLIYKK